MFARIVTFLLVLASLSSACCARLSTSGDAIHTAQQAELDAELISGVESAEAFRRELLSTGVADELARTIAQASGIPGLTADTVLEAVTGGLSRAQLWDALTPFDGDWEGRWQSMDVEHTWESRLDLARPVPISDTTELALIAYQFAWVGDGYGWNIEARVEAGSVLLGSVYHLDPNTGEPAYHVPHVGVPLGRGHVAWIVPGYLYLERVEGDATYQITQLQWGPDDASEGAREVYQTTYRRPQTAFASN